MNLNLECGGVAKGTVYCHICNKDIDLHQDLINVDNTWECLTCGAMLGYDSDLIGIFFNEEDINDE